MASLFHMTPSDLTTAIKTPQQENQGYMYGPVLRSFKTGVIYASSASFGSYTQ
jgi:hypothetical protein